MDLKEFHKRASSYINTIGPEQEKQLKEFLVCLVSWYFTNENISTYISGQYDKDEDFQRLKKHIEEREGDRENRNRYNL
jgi:glucose-6-phosphate 1-dehydrogenase